MASAVVGGEKALERRPFIIHYAEPVAPVLDGMVTGFKMAEMMADINSLTSIPPVSRTGFFQLPPKSDFGTLREFLGR